MNESESSEARNWATDGHSRRGTEYTCDENALHRAYRAKVTKHYECLQAKKFWFVPVVAATSGALQPETVRLLYDFARLTTDTAEQHAAANSLSCILRMVRSTFGLYCPG